jgi:hypothetical protein
MTVTQNVQGLAPTFWEASWYALTFDKVSGSTPATLSDSITPQSPDDQTFAYQWDVTLSAGQTFIVTLTNSIRLEPVVLNIAPSGSDIKISWPTNSFVGFRLQSSTNIGAGSDWTTVTNLPAVVNTQYQVSVPITGSAQFYRLQQ